MLQRAISMENPFLWKISLANEKILCDSQKLFQNQSKRLSKTIKIKGEIESLKEKSKEKQKFQIQTKPHFMN